MKENSPISFNHVHQIVRGRIGLPDSNITITNPILAQDSLDFVLVDVCKGYSIRNRDTSLIFLADCDIGWPLIETDAKAFKFPFDDLFVAQGF